MAIQTMGIETSSGAQIIDTPSSGAGLRGQALSNKAMQQGLDAGIDASDQYNLYEAGQAEEEAILAEASTLTSKNKKIAAASTSSTGSAAHLLYSSRMTRLANRSTPETRAKINAMATNRLKYNPTFSAAIAEQKAKDTFRADAIVKGTQIALETGKGVVDSDTAFQLYVDDTIEDAKMQEVLEAAELVKANATSDDGRQKAATSVILAKGNVARSGLTKEIQRALGRTLEEGKGYLNSKGIDSTGIKNIDQYRTVIRTIYLQQINRLQDSVKDDVLNNPNLRNYSQASAQIESFLKQGETLKVSVNDDETWDLLSKTSKGLIDRATVALLSDPNFAHIASILSMDFKGAGLPLETVVDIEEFKKRAAQMLKATGKMPFPSSNTNETADKLANTYYARIGDALEIKGDKGKIPKIHVEKVNEDVDKLNKHVINLEKITPDVAKAVLNVSNAVFEDADKIENQNRSMRRVIDNSIIPSIEKEFNKVFKTKTGMLAEFISHFSIVDGPTTDQSFNLKSIININVLENGTPIFKLGDLTSEQQEIAPRIEEYVKILNTQGKKLGRSVATIARNNNVSVKEAMAELLGDRLGYNVKNKKEITPPKTENKFIIYNEAVGKQE